MFLVRSLRDFVFRIYGVGFGRICARVLQFRDVQGSWLSAICKGSGLGTVEAVYGLYLIQVEVML